MTSLGSLLRYDELLTRPISVSIAPNDSQDIGGIFLLIEIILRSYGAFPFQSDHCDVQRVTKDLHNADLDHSSNEEL